jgi:hypothetical protein
MTTNTRKPNARALWIDTRAAELVGKGWKPATATKRATKEWRLHSPQHVAAQKRNRDLARARYAI